MKKTLFAKISNRVLHLMARNLPGALTIRPFLHRLRGVKIQKNVWIGDDVYIENEHPECIEIHENTSISLRITIIAHTRGLGKIIIGKNVYIGCGCVITCPPNYTLTIGEGSVITANTAITKSISPFSFVSGSEAKTIAKVTVPLLFYTSYADFIAGLVPVRRKKQSNRHEN